MPPSFPDSNQKEILNRYRMLPPDIQGVFFSQDAADELFRIGQAEKLQIDEIGRLGDAVALFMLGMVTPGQFIERVRASTGKDPAAASRIAQTLNERLFAPIRESLKAIHGNEWGRGIAAETKPPEKNPPRPPEERPQPPAIPAPNVRRPAPAEPSASGPQAPAPAAPPSIPAAAEKPLPPAEKGKTAEEPGPRPFIINPLPWYRKGETLGARGQTLETKSEALGIRGSASGTKRDAPETAPPVPAAKPSVPEQKIPAPGGAPKPVFGTELKPAAPISESKPVTEKPIEIKPPAAPAMPLATAPRPPQIAGEEKTDPAPAALAAARHTIDLRTQAPNPSPPAPEPQTRGPEPPRSVPPQPQIPAEQSVKPAPLPSKPAQPPVRPRDIFPELLKAKNAEPKIPPEATKETPPPAVPESYRAAREAFEKEFAEYKNRKEEESRQQNDASRPIAENAGSTKAPDADEQRAAKKPPLPPLHLVGGKYPKPQAPNQYALDPYKEPVE